MPRGGWKGTINAALGVAGLRLVNAGWGPRGAESALRRLVRAGHAPRRIVDVGASDGLWTRGCLAILPGADYFLIEPLAEHRPALAVLAAQRSNVRYWIGAAGAAEAAAAGLHVHGDQSSFLPSESFAAAGPARQVPVRTLDSFLGRELAAGPELIKADVQGWELEVLAGATQALASAEFLLLEVSYLRMYARGPLAHEVIAWCGARGFRILEVCSYVQRPSDGALAQSDILFARDGSRVFADEGYH